MDSQDIEITRLSDHPKHSDTVVEWIYDEWGRDHKETREDIRAVLLERPNWPGALVAISAGQVLGILGFKRYRPPLVDGEDNADDKAAKEAEEDQGETELALWINILYVAEDRRGQGIGTALLDRSVQVAREVDDAGPLYVYTDVPRFYEKLGWVGVRHNINGGFDVFRLDL